jgi:TRAP-type C4-dicarboxylate transport system substrate-binding protein
MNLKSKLVLGALMGAVAFAAQPAAAEIDKKEFRVVGTWGFLDHWKEREGPFWKTILPKASGGKLTANAKSNTELGLSGYEVMKLLKLGMFDAVHAVTTYVAQESPELEGADLSGVIQDLPTYRKANEAYRHIIAREVEEKFNAKLLMLYGWPSQQLWCNLGDKKN